MSDPFRPRSDPARRIYDTLLDETKHRNSRETGDWILAERQRVWREARDYAQENGLRVPTLEQIETCETLAAGHTDYCAQFAYKVAALL